MIGSLPSHTRSFFTIVAAANTNLGGRRKLNADSYAAFPNKGLFVLADGVGDDQKGQTASRTAVNSIGRSFWAGAATPPSQRVANLVDSIRRTSGELFRQANPHLGKMETTVVALHVDKINGWSYVAHVGDSRAYRIRQNRIEQLTEDHSEFAEWTRNPVGPQPTKNILTQALGWERDVYIEMTSDLVENEDVFLLCSDGLHRVLSDDVMLNLVLSESDLNAAGARLIWEANRANGSDNITVGLIKAVL